MTWTYSGDPSSTDRDAVRFAVGDTDTNDQQVTDEEIAYLLDRDGSVNAAALSAAEAIYAKFARLVDKSVDKLKLSYSQRKDQYAELVERLRRRLTTGTVLPYAGGLSESRKDTLRDDTDLVQPAFRRDQFRNPRRGDHTDDDDCNRCC